MWLASPALPVGGFSYSEGLEAAVDKGLANDETTATTWLTDQLHLGLARSDLVVVNKAMAAWKRDDKADIAALNAWVLHTRESSEMRQQTEQMGRSLTLWLAQRGRAGEVAQPDQREPQGDDMPRRTPFDTRQATVSRMTGSSTPDDATAQPTPADAPLDALLALTPAATWPIAFALAARRTGAAPREALLAFAFGWAENMVQAALKSIPLGQSAGQRVLAQLVAAIPDAVDDAMKRTIDERQAFMPMLAIVSAQHETQYSRLFRS